ncbi:hypothetical protein C1H46_045474 [Malus baccata]|uniref:Uncharacterized protein n=1 Tax=Malus baccata TaxID=106549 RepID=A0A540K435_MALBA|nr:hypothetical protein C1H46_045474 [Malus baccata]
MTRQICGKHNHLADTCRFRNAPVSQGCQIYGKNNHFTDTCQFRNVGLNSGCQIYGNSNHSALFCFQKNSITPMNAMYAHTNSRTQSNSSLPSAPPQQV